MKLVLSGVLDVLIMYLSIVRPVNASAPPLAFRVVQRMGLGDWMGVTLTDHSARGWGLPPSVFAIGTL